MLEGYKREKGINSFWEEFSTNAPLLRNLATQLEEVHEVLALTPEQQLIILFSKADFCSEQERIYVVRIVKDRLSDLDILPQVTEHQGIHLASKCLISLGLFEGHMWHRTNRYGAPSPEFYRQVGKAQFERCGQLEVARNFDDWTDYINVVFTKHKL